MARPSPERSRRTGRSAARRRASDDGRISTCPRKPISNGRSRPFQSLPDTATIAEAIERLCFIAKVEEGLRQSRDGEVLDGDSRVCRSRFPTFCEGRCPTFDPGSRSAEGVSPVGKQLLSTEGGPFTQSPSIPARDSFFREISGARPALVVVESDSTLVPRRQDRWFYSVQLDSA